MKLPELKELARQLGLRGISGMRKPVLIETIEAARSGGKAPEGVTVGKPKAAAAVAKGGQATDQQQPTKQETDSSAEGGQETTDTKGSEESKDDRPVGDLFDVLGIDDHKSGHSEHRTRFPHTVADEENVVISRRRHRSTDSSRGFHSNRGRNEHEHDEERAGSGSVRNLDDILAALPSRNDRPRRRSYEDRGEEGRDYRHNGYDRRNRGDRNDRNDRNDRRNRNNHRSSGRDRDYEPRENFKPEDLVPVAGIVDVLDSYAFVRTSGYLPGPNDVYISMGQVKKYGLRKGDAVHGSIRPPREGEHRNQRQKFVPLQAIDTINGMSVEEAAGRPHFNKLTPLYPQERMRMETQPKNITGRLIDIVAPIGKGQRGLIVSPPKAGKTLTLQSIANSITANNPEVHLMVVLVDERPEEVTDMERTVQGEVISSTFDRPASDHTTVAELAIERAKRLVELGQDVVVLLDSMTRLARAYNISAPASGRILSGGVDAQALYPPKRFFGAARNIENGGSLTIISSALVETGSKMDEVIFEEFKGTGNMELRLTRDLADKRMFPAIDINASGTRREELITAPEELAVVYRLRRLLGGMETEQAYQTLVPRLKKTATNRDFLSAINQSMLAQK
ncbi:transcription termination factor Rho [Bifidobacterium asteroides]